MTEQKGDEFKKEGEKALQAGGLGGWFGPSKSERANSAIDCYTKAANQYKIAKACMYYRNFPICALISLGNKAGVCFNDCAELYVDQAHGNYQAASNFSKAAEMFRKDDRKRGTALLHPFKNCSSYFYSLVSAHSLAITCLQRAVKLFLDDGKFSSAAKQNQCIAEMHEEDGRITDAIIAYEKTCDYYEAENSARYLSKFVCSHFISTGMACLLKAAYLSIDAVEYQRAIDILEKVAAYYATNNLTNFKCKTLFLEASICRLFLGVCILYFPFFNSFQFIS
jgi:tetratricopeptide (TPR) repeat protein